MFVLLLVLLNTSFAKMDWKVALKNKYYFTGLHKFLISSQKVKTVTEKQSLLLEEILLLTGVDVLHDYNESILLKFKNPSVYFHFGRKHIMNKRYQQGLALLAKIPKDHRYRGEVMYLKAFADLQSGKKIEEVNDELDECMARAQRQMDKAPNKDMRNFYGLVSDSCLVQRARDHFNHARYKESIAAYGRVDKRAFKWPYLLLERAWASYHVQDYNRSLGLLVTYQSPLLEDYFSPEAEILVALNYFRLCLYQDAEMVIDEFYKRYKPITEDIKSQLKNKELYSHFYKVLQKKSDIKAAHPFLKKILTQVAREMRFHLDVDSLNKVEVEYGRLKKLGKNEYAGDMNHLSAIAKNYRDKINRYTYEAAVKFVNQLHIASEELFKIKLEIISQKKNLIYRQEELVSNRSRGDTGNVKRTRFEFFWDFNGSFWADEIGDYTFGLKSNCDVKALKEEEEKK